MNARTMSRRARVSGGAVIVSMACSSSDGAAPSDPGGPNPPPAGSYSHAALAWKPGRNDTCTQQDHLRYTATGPDGKLYPVWHPPVDPLSGCSFGHDHGRDPSASRLALVSGPVLFGVANEMLDAYDAANPRHEDHVGQKIEWEDGVTYRPAKGYSGSSITCDVLIKLHQGTHSADALTNNLHELVWNARCSDGSEVHLTFLAAIGNPGEFAAGCNETRVFHPGPASPANSPPGLGARKIPERVCIVNQVFNGAGFSAFGESWQVASPITRVDGEALVRLGAYFNVAHPSRYFYGGQPGNVARSVDLCWEMPAGTPSKNNPCTALAAAPPQSVAWDDAASPFSGAERTVLLRNFRVNNADGPTVWYTTPFGTMARPDSFPGSIRQVIASMAHPAGWVVEGPLIGRGRSYGGGGVHAPN